MRLRDLIVDNLRHYRRTHLGVVLGAACGTAVLVGALAVGDSVRLSLRQQAENRIGRVDAVMSTPERFFREELSSLIEDELDGVVIAPLLSLPGIARAAEGSSRAGIVNVYGVDDRFFGLGPRGESRSPPKDGQCFLNARLAHQLEIGPGDSILLRVERPSLMPRDMVMSTVDDLSFAIRVEVEAIVDEGDFGRFSLRGSQVPPFNLFLALDWLGRELELEGRINLLAVAGGADLGALDDALARRWTIEDAQLKTVTLGVGEGVHGQALELISERVFIEDEVVEAANEIAPGLAGVLTYFVNDLRHGERHTPYSMVSAIGPLSPRAPPDDATTRALLDLLPEELGGGIVVNDWLAKDLSVAAGDEIELSYYVLGPRLELKEAQRSFTVRSVVPLAGAAADETLMPEFPGLADAESCRDWETGIPVDRNRLEEEDQAYWEDHRGTPKAFIGLDIGRETWGNRFGRLSSIRGSAESLRRVAEELPRRLGPEKLGFFFQDLRGPALAGGTSATDFGGLFLGLSLFLIVAALLLTALLFAFGIEQRANEIGLLLALGYTPKRVRRLFLLEAVLLAGLGGVIGSVAGIAYTHGILRGLGSLWRDAVGITTLSAHLRLETVAIGVASSILSAVAAIALAIRKSFRHPAVELLQSRNGLPVDERGQSSKARRVAPVVAVIGLLGAIVLATITDTDSDGAASAFFGAGGLLLVAVVAACRVFLCRQAASQGPPLASIAGLGRRNAGRRPGRSLATIALLATGTFLVVGIQAKPARAAGPIRGEVLGHRGICVLRALDVASYCATSNPRRGATLSGSTPTSSTVWPSCPCAFRKETTRAASI